MMKFKTVRQRYREKTKQRRRLIIITSRPKVANSTKKNSLTLGTDAATGPMYAKISGRSIEKRLEELRSSGMSSTVETSVIINQCISNRPIANN